MNTLHVAGWESLQVLEANYSPIVKGNLPWVNIDGYAVQPIIVYFHMVITNTFVG
jgi:hypothetical protein